MILQQKMFMPPATDEQSAMQQKVMKYMMIFMGVLFYKVASGLCLYFIASSLWGLAERKFLPKTAAGRRTAADEPSRRPGEETLAVVVFRRGRRQAAGGGRRTAAEGRMRKEGVRRRKDEG